MIDYKSLYYQLFNKITDVIDELKKAQIEVEEMYMNSDIGTDKKEEAKLSIK